MVGLQASIGALNDLVDAPLDAGRKPRQADPGRAGLTRGGPGGHGRTAGSIGLLLAFPSGPGLVALAGLILAIGYGYDLLAKGTAWSWIPFAIGIPLLPVFGWYGAVGTLPAPFAILLPTAVMAGAALAIANARADVERDRQAGLDSIAIRLGSRRSWATGAVLLALVMVAALGSLWIAGAPPLTIAASIVAALVLGVGVALGASPTADRRERAWEVQAIAVALLGAAWVWGIGRLG